MPVIQVSEPYQPWLSVSVGNAMTAATSCMLVRNAGLGNSTTPERDLGIADALTIELDFSLGHGEAGALVQSSARAISDCPGVTNERSFASLKAARNGMRVKAGEADDQPADACAMVFEQQHAGISG